MPRKRGRPKAADWIRREDFAEILGNYMKFTETSAKDLVPDLASSVVSVSQLRRGKLPITKERADRLLLLVEEQANNFFCKTFSGELNDAICDHFELEAAELLTQIKRRTKADAS